MPANGETSYVHCKPVLPVDVSLSLLKKEVNLYDTAGAPDPKRPCRMHGVLIMKDNVNFKLVYDEFNQADRIQIGFKIFGARTSIWRVRLKPSQHQVHLQRSNTIARNHF